MSITAQEQTKVVRGALVTVLGGIALALYQSADFVLSGVFGLANFGLYALAAAAIEVSFHLIVSGFLDAITYFAARPLYGDASAESGSGAGDSSLRERLLYRTLATAIGAPFVLALAVAIVTQLAAPAVYRGFWREHDPVVIDLLTTAVWSLPALVLVVLPTEALKTRLEVKWSVAITQIVLPYLTATLALAIHLLTDIGILAMSIAVLAASWLCVPLALWAYSRAFSWRRTAQALVRETWHLELIRFALPQSLNMALGLGMVRVDTLVLSGVCDATTLGVYSLVVKITQLTRLAKMAFSGLFGPLVAKFHAAGDRQAIGLALRRFAGFSGAWGIAAAMILLTLYPDLVFAKHAAQWTYSPVFPWLLCLGPLLSCFFGFAANLLLMTGHSRLLLMNAALSLTLNVALNLWLAAAYGVVGAAVATAIASLFISALQLIEMTLLEKHAMPWKVHLRTLIAATPSLGLVAIWHSGWWPNALASWRSTSSWIADIGCAFVAFSVYVLLQSTLPQRSALRFRLSRDDDRE